MSNENLIAELEAQIRDLREADKAAAAELRDSVKPVWRYSITLETSGFDKIFDPAVLKFRLSGECVNKAECEAVGQRIEEGGYSYLYNTATKSVIGGFGGGRLYLSDHKGFSRSATDFLGQGIRDLSAFLASHPEGGDCTHVVRAHQYAKECHHNGLFATTEAQPGDTFFCPSCEYDIAMEDL